MHYYSASSKQIRRIEGVTHSQVYALLRATVKGLPTIREFHAQTYLQNSFKQALDVHGSWKLAYHVAGRYACMCRMHYGYCVQPILINSKFGRSRKSNIQVSAPECEVHSANISSIHACRWLATRLDFAAIGLLAYLLLVATGGKLWNTPLVHLALLHVLQIFGLSSVRCSLLY